jgi:hypothetical protein
MEVDRCISKRKFLQTNNLNIYSTIIAEEKALAKVIEGAKEKNN